MMLGKTAGGLYWMFRYLERSENTARLMAAGQRIALTRSHADDEWASVLETTAPEVLLARKAALIAAMPAVAAADGADEVLLFIVDILREEATLLVPNSWVAGVATRSFGVPVTGDTVVLPGIISRKKQIIPALVVE